MKVKATERGHYGGKLREEGDSFEFTPVKKPKGHKGDWLGDKPGSWMEEVKPQRVIVSPPDNDGTGDDASGDANKAGGDNGGTGDDNSDK